MKICKVENCNNKHCTKGYCNKHYMQQYRHGNVLLKTRFDDNSIGLYNNYALIELCDKNQEIVGYTKIDLVDVDRCRQYKWFLTKNGYCRGYINGKQISLHSFIIGFKSNIYKVIDHINRDRLDNTNENLRVVDYNMNAYNKGVQKNNTTGIVGVSRNRNKYRSQICKNKRKVNLGNWANIDNAIYMRTEMEKWIYG